VVSHVRTDHRDWSVFRQPGGGVVEGLVETVPTAGAGGGQATEVPESGRRIDHGRQARRIGSDDDVLAEPPAQSEARHSEVRILVRHLQVARVVARLRYAPGDTPLGTVRDLAAYDEPACLVQQAPRRRPHHQGRHQVLEHRSRPGHEDRVLFDGRQGTAEPEPGRDRDIALRDRDEARETGLRGEQVVPAGVEAPVRDTVPDREELPHRVEEEAEVHAGDQCFRISGEDREATDQGLGGGGGTLQFPDECLNWIGSWRTLGLPARAEEDRQPAHCGLTTV
jgi:hypothetical protein